MVKLSDLKIVKSKIVEEGVYELVVNRVIYETGKVDKNKNKYEMWKLELISKTSGFRLYKNILVYDEEEVNKVGKEQLVSLIELLGIDFDNLTIEESELNAFLAEKLTKLEVVSIVRQKNGWNELEWLYGIERREWLLNKFRCENNKDEKIDMVIGNIEKIDDEVKEIEKIDEEVAEIEKVDKVSLIEAHQVLENHKENEIQIKKETSTQSDANVTGDVNYVDFIKFD